MSNSLSPSIPRNRADNKPAIPPYVAWELSQVILDRPPNGLTATDLGKWAPIVEYVQDAPKERRGQVLYAKLLEAGLDKDTVEAIQKQIMAFPPDAPCPKLPPKTVWSHKELMAAEFPKQQWIVDGLIPDEGLTLLGAKKKRGKTYLGTQFAVGVATGAPVLGRATIKGPVVYYALEDGPRRIQERLQKQGAEGDLPITWVYRCTPLDVGGMAELESTIAIAKPSLLVIDTLAAAKSGRTDENDAGDMADLANHLRELAQDAHLAILLIVHHGKSTGGDAGDDVRGSSAIAAAADLNLGLYKTDTGHILKGEGRDIEPFELRVEFDAARSWAWQLLGDHNQLAKEEAEDEVLETLAALEEADAGRIAKEIGKSRIAAQGTLRRLANTGRVTRRSDKPGGRILYRISSQEREE